jgi:hypothetical protein
VVTLLAGAPTLRGKQVHADVAAVARLLRALPTPHHGR